MELKGPAARDRRAGIRIAAAMEVLLAVTIALIQVEKVVVEALPSSLEEKEEWGSKS